MNTNDRIGSHRRVEEVEYILRTLAEGIPDIFPEPLAVKYPIIFIIGCARSGTTLVSQYLSKLGSFCYPTNFISRFYFSPYVGALLQKLMFDLDVKGELFGSLKDRGDFRSNLGKTTGALAPNEFWYYWRRFFKFGDIQRLSAEELARIDINAFVRGLNAIQTVFDKPMFLKGMIANWHIPFLAEHIPSSYFIVVKREVVYNAQSLYFARQKFFGNVNKWYSFKPEEYELLRSKDPLEQVVGQVIYTNRAIDQGTKLIPDERVIELKYEDFCQNPLDVIRLLEGKFSVEVDYWDALFKDSNSRKLDMDKWSVLNDLVARYL